MSELLWTPSAERVASTRMDALRRSVGAADAGALHRWSVDNPGEFWQRVWDDCGVIGTPGDVAFDAGDGTTLACVSLRHASAHDGMRLLMSQIGIRAVASVQELEAVLVRDSPEQVGKALQLLADFDRPAP